MGEPKPVRPGIAAAEAGARWWSCAVQAARSTPRDAVHHGDLYDLGAELVATVGSLEELAGLLARRCLAYQQRSDLRDDTGADPAARLEAARVSAAELRAELQVALRSANDFWSAIGHIGLQYDPDEQHPDRPDTGDDLDRHDPDQQEEEEEQ